MKTIQLLLSVALYTSGIFGIQILLMDRWLWNAAPSHALGLVLFVTIDALVLIGMWKKPGLASLGALLVSFVQLGAMLGDIVNGQPTGISTDTFRSYLLADTAFKSLLVMQGIILALATITLAVPYFASNTDRFSLLRKR